jgi:hypothetical protein
MAEALLADPTLTDDEASIKRLDAASAPLMATLDEIAARGDATEQLVAEYAKGDLLFGLQARLRDSIPAITPHLSLEATQAIERRHRLLEPRLAHWGKEATDAFRRVTQIARANPKLISENPVVRYMAREAARLPG